MEESLPKIARLEQSEISTEMQSSSGLYLIETSTSDAVQVLPTSTSPDTSHAARSAECNQLVILVIVTPQYPLPLSHLLDRAFHHHTPKCTTR